MECTISTSTQCRFRTPRSSLTIPSKTTASSCSLESHLKGSFQRIEIRCFELLSTFLLGNILSDSFDDIHRPGRQITDVVLVFLYTVLVQR